MKTLAALLLVGLTTPAMANLTNEAQIIFGSIAPQTDVEIQGKSKIGDTGLAVGARYLGEVSPVLKIGAEFVSLNSGETASSTLITGANSTTKFSSLLFMAEAKLHAREGKIQPFVLAGVGLHSTNLKIDSTPQAGFVWANTGTRETRSAVDATKTGAAFTLQAGLDFTINDRLALGVAGGWYGIGKATYDSTAVARQTVPSFAGVEGSINSLAFIANLTYRF